MGLADLESVVLAKGTAEIKREEGRELSIYYISDQSPTLVTNGKSIHLEIVFKRRLTNEAVMTFLPSLLLISLSYSTSFFRLPTFFNTAITVNLSVMLTLTTLLISVVKKLAQTSYIKWIEYWLIFAQLIPFIQVILITGLESQKEEKDDKKQKVATEESSISIGGQLIKVKKKICLKLFQVQPLFSVHSTNEKDPSEIVHLLTTIKRRVVPLLITVAVTLYWVFGLMFHYDVL